MRCFCGRRSFVQLEGRELCEEHGNEYIQRMRRDDFAMEQDGFRLTPEHGSADEYRKAFTHIIKKMENFEVEITSKFSDLGGMKWYQEGFRSISEKAGELEGRGVTATAPTAPPSAKLQGLVQRAGMTPKPSSSERRGRSAHHHRRGGRRGG